MRLMMFGVVLTLVAGCALEDGALLPPPEPTPQPIAYVAAKDGRHVIPALDPARVPVEYQRAVVANPLPEAEPGTILVDTGTRHLYLVQDRRHALRYGIGVGRDGFGWSGETTVARKAHWPTWTPPPEMIRRQPSLSQWANGQPGGPRNPLGARAIYLYQDGRDTGFRIHGTPEWWTVGQNASSGCFRMIQQDVVDLYERVAPGARVIVR